MVCFEVNGLWNIIRSVEEWKAKENVEKVIKKKKVYEEDLGEINFIVATFNCSYDFHEINSGNKFIP